MDKITPFLWFNDNAEEAIKLYTSVFKKSKIKSIVRYGKAGPGPEGAVMTASLQLFGQNFILLNGGPQFKFTEAISFVVHCDTQKEVDAYWNKLSANGGQTSRCGWLKDRFGLWWQIVPTALPKLLQQKDPEKSKRVVQAMMQMEKIDIAGLKKAAKGR